MANMEIKLHRGPMHGKRMVLDSFNDQLEVARPPKVIDLVERKNFPDDQPMPIQRGCYKRSNESTKDGAVIFEWMGWYA